MSIWNKSQLEWQGHLRGSDDDLASLLARVDAEDAKSQQLLDKLQARQHEMQMRKAPASVVRKTLIGEVNSNLEYILSTESVDRYGDIISAAGWQLEKFNRNPVCLFSHDANFPVGVWKNVGVSNGALKGKLDLAPQGSSPRIDEIRALVSHGALKATSVGFLPLAFEPLPSGGKKYTKAELLEVSLVSTPANSDCLQIAKSLNVSEATLNMCFTKSAAVRQLSPIDRKLRNTVDAVADNVGKIIKRERDRTDKQILALRVELLKKSGEDSSYIRGAIEALRRDLMVTRESEREEINDLIGAVGPYRRKRDAMQ